MPGQHLFFNKILDKYLQRDFYIIYNSITHSVELKILLKETILNFTQRNQCLCLLMMATEHSLSFNLMFYDT